MTVLTYYPGCSLKSSSRFYEDSIKKVCSFYNIQLKELDDWSCCGASAAHTIDEDLAYALPARNLGMAEKEGYHFFAPCSACYSRSKITNEKIRKDKVLREEINRVIGPHRCVGSIEVKNIIEIFHDHVGMERIAKRIAYDLSSIKIVPYYGCVLTRLMKMDAFDDREDPRSMDWLLWSLGIESKNWPFKMECCGASKTLTNKDVTLRLSSKIMDMAQSSGAEAIVTPCPLCQLNLDLLPNLGRTGTNVPVLFLTEVFELAIFGKIDGTHSHMISVEGLVKKVKPKEIDKK